MKDSASEVREVAATLEAAAHEAPPSLRAEEIRSTLLADLDGGSSWVRGGLTVAAMVAGALLLAGAIGVGGTMIGALLEPTRDNRPPPRLQSSPIPSPTPGVSATERPSPRPTPSVARTPVPSAAGEAATPRASAVPEVTPQPMPTIPPQESPGGPPDPLPTPPITGPPPGVP